MFFPAACNSLHSHFESSTYRSRRYYPTCLTTSNICPPVFHHFSDSIINEFTLLLALFCKTLLCCCPDFASLTICLLKLFIGDLIFNEIALVQFSLWPCGILSFQLLSSSVATFLSPRLNLMVLIINGYLLSSSSGGARGGYEGGKYTPTVENLSKIVIEKCNKRVWVYPFTPSRKVLAFYTLIIFCLAPPLSSCLFHLVSLTFSSRFANLLCFLSAFLPFVSPLTVLPAFLTSQHILVTQ